MARWLMDGVGPEDQKRFELDKYKWKPRKAALMKVRFGGFEIHKC